MINRRDFIQLGASSILALSASRFAFAKSDTQVDLRIVATTDIHSFLTDFDYYKDAPTEKFGFTLSLIHISTARSTNTLNCLFNDGLIVINDSNVCNEVMVTIPTIGASLLVTFLKNAGK